MWTPMEPNLGEGDDGIPAADPGAGAPPPAGGFGIGGEEPDRPEETDAAPGTDDGDGIHSMRRTTRCARSWPGAGRI